MMQLIILKNVAQLLFLSAYLSDGVYPASAHVIRFCKQISLAQI